MRIEYTGRQTEVSPGLRALAEKKLQKLARVLPRITSVHVILGNDKQRQTAEVTVHSSNLDLTAAEEANDLGFALSTVIDKLTRQAQKHRGKLRKRRPPEPPRALWAGVVAAPMAEGAGGPRVIRSHRFVPKPMTVDEAVLEVRASTDGCLVFRDSRTERLNVLYRRKDGNFGLIEPEA